MYKTFENILKVVLLFIFLFADLGLAQDDNFDFNSGTSMGWKGLRKPTSYNDVFFAWDDFVNYPAYPYDPVNNQKGSISFQSSSVITNTGDINMEFRSPTILWDTDWQTAIGFTARFLILGSMVGPDPEPYAYLRWENMTSATCSGDFDMTFATQGWVQVTVYFPEKPFQVPQDSPREWFGIHFHYGNGLAGMYGGVFMDDVTPIFQKLDVKAPTPYLLDGYHESIVLAWNKPDAAPVKPDEKNYYNIHNFLRQEKYISKEIKSKFELLHDYTGLNQTNQPQSLSNPAIENNYTYNIYRSTQSGGPYTLVGSTNKQYYRDLGVTNSVSYYYVITVVYDTGESDYSEEVNGSAVFNGYTILSAAAGNEPVLDGIINTNEWGNATQTDITFPGSSRPVTLYMMNSADYLYVAVDDKNDTVLNHGDQFMMYIDEDSDREWPTTSPSGEGNLWLVWDGNNNTTFNSFRPTLGWWPDNLELETVFFPNGVQQGISIQSGNMQYEGKISLTNSPINITAEKKAGVLFGIYDYEIEGFTASWPQAAEDLTNIAPDVIDWGKYPFAYGDLLLATSSGVETVSKPDRPIGNGSGDVFEILSYSTGGAVNSLGHTLQYQFDWGDGTFSDWGGKDQSHQYTTAGTHKIKARVRCSVHTNIISDWSDGKNVDIRGYLISLLNPQELGTIYIEPDKEEYDYNEYVSFYAIAEPGYEFDHWSGSYNGTDNPVTLMINSDLSLTAHFKFVSKVNQTRIPDEYRLYQNYPNPFNASTTLSYSLKSSGLVRIEIYNQQGQLVKNLIHDYKNAGIHKIIWDGSDNQGNMAPSGIYIERLISKNYIATKKMILLK